ncbi:MAG: flagellar basal body rod protein FlgB [Thermoguttaceae bacterium]
MLSGLFQATTIPVLEQVVCFAQARHNVLAANIANMDTPGYEARDLSVQEFQEKLKAAIQDRDHPSTMSPGEADFQPAVSMADVAKGVASVSRHDEGNGSLEARAAGMAQNQMQHNMAIALLVDQFRLLNAAISEKA